MSHQPSPSPSVSQHPSTSRHKQKPFATGITAGAEDVKYQVKYKELKRKVKEVETDNDKLYIKVLQAKRNIQRMRLERAILYERLYSVPPSPGKRDNNPLPPVHAGPAIIPPQTSPHVPPSGRRHAENHEQGQHIDPNDHGLIDYMSNHGNMRVMDGRPISVPEPSIGLGVAPPSAHGLQIYDARHGSGGHDSSRQLPPLPHLIPPPNQRQHSSPHLHAGSPHERYRPPHTPSRSRSHQPQMTPHAEPSHVPPFGADNISSGPHALQNTPPSGDREWGRRHDLRDLTNSHESRVQVTSQPIVPQSAHPAQHEGRLPGSGRPHHQSRMAGSVRYDDREYDREREWADQEMSRERELSRNSSSFQSPPVYHSRPIPERMDYQERVEYNDRSTSRVREEPGIYAGTNSGPGYMISRSGSPGSGSGSGYGGDGGSRADAQHLFERDRRYPSRTPNPSTNEDPEFAREEGGRSQRSRDPGGAGPEHTRPSLDLRRHSWQHDMEVVGENDVDGSGARELSSLSSGHPDTAGRYPTESNSRGRDNGRNMDE